MNDPEVIVVGAGPAGMLLSLLLSRSRVNVLVLEQARTFEREFRGELLQPGALRILEDVGLLERHCDVDRSEPRAHAARRHGADWHANEDTAKIVQEHRGPVFMGQSQGPGELRAVATFGRAPMTSAMLTLLYSIPSLMLLAGAIVIAVLLAAGGQVYVHRRFQDQDFVQHDEVGGFIIAVVGTCTRCCSVS